jgi:type I restriction enzyme M protein
MILAVVRAECSCSQRILSQHGGRLNDISIYGQERNNTTWRLCKMNLAVRGIDADIKWNNEGSFAREEFSNVKFDFILANPPFNVSDWWRSRFEDDIRWSFGTPPQGNANYAWLSHIYHHLAPRGTAGVVLANGSMSSQQSGEGEIRKKMIEADVIDCMVALTGQLFYSTQIPACLWFLARDKIANGHRDRRGEILFIDARNLGQMVDRTRRELSAEDIEKIAGTYHRWRAKGGAYGLYEDVPGFCKSAKIDEIAKHGFILTPGRYVGATDVEDDGVPFEERFAELRAKLEEHFAEAEELTATIRSKLAGVGVDE